MAGGPAYALLGVTIMAAILVIVLLGRDRRPVRRGNQTTTIAAVNTCMSTSVPTAAASSKPSESGAASESRSATTATIVKVLAGSCATRR